MLRNESQNNIFIKNRTGINKGYCEKKLLKH